MTVADYILTGKERLESVSLECANPLVQMKHFVQHYKRWTAADLVVHWNDALTDRDLNELDALLFRRLNGEPYQYIVGGEWFWDFFFAVGPGVLIPRPETEVLVEKVLSLPLRPGARIGELGPGSGNIGLTILREKSDLDWLAYEINPQSLPFLQRNRIEILKTPERYQIIAGDFFEKAKVDGPFDAIISNPPYVSDGDWPMLSQEVRSEPQLALLAGERGLDVLARLIAEGRTLLSPGGYLICEFSPEQTDDLRATLSANGYVDIDFIVDYSGRMRVFCAKRGDK